MDELHERIWKTADGRYVADGHPEAAILAAGPADRLPDDFDPATFERIPGTSPTAAPEPEPDVEPEPDAEPEPAAGKRGGRSKG